MNATSLTLIGYISWMMLLVFSIISYRSIVVLTSRKAANDFQPEGKDVSPLMERLSRVHANCYEHFPIFAGLMLLALALNLSEITNPLAYTFLTLRVAQGVVHIISKSVPMVFLRLGLFLAQCGIAVYWIVLFLKHV